jgi:hypothetical protein
MLIRFIFGVNYFCRRFLNRILKSLGIFEVGTDCERYSIELESLKERLVINPRLSCSILRPTM